MRKGKSNKSRKHGEDKSGLSSNKFVQIQKESSKIAIELNHGMMVEALKKIMFAAEELWHP